MQITIDTDKESKEDLKKLISFLKNIVGDHSSYSSSDDSNSFDLPSTGGMMGMFGDDSSSSTYDSSEPEDDEKKDDIPRIEVF